MGYQQSQQYEGLLTLPGIEEPQTVSLELNAEDSAVKIHFESPIEGSSEWNGSSVRVAQRLKYQEVVFYTTGLPKESVELTWKFNASLLDDSLAGVIIARPNDLRIKGEKGFVLSQI